MNTCVYCEKEIDKGMACDECCDHVGKAYHIDILKEAITKYHTAIDIALPKLEYLRDKSPDDIKQMVTDIINVLEGGLKQ